MTALLTWRDLLPSTAKTFHNRDRLCEDVPEHRAPIKWPPGPWTHEPDKVSWTDPATGRPCMIHRNRMGNLCGYVGVDPGHPWYKVDYDTPLVTVHGGLTYSDLCDPDGNEEYGLCHIPEPGCPDDVWWLGFDTGHAFDLTPGLIATEEFFNRSYFIPGRPAWARETYKGMAYVIRETLDLAQQVAAA